MIKTKNLLASLSLEIPALEADSEGQLRGGFSSYDVATFSNDTFNTNCDCGCNNGCEPPSPPVTKNENCNCGCTNPKCKTTPSTSTGGGGKKDNETTVATTHRPIICRLRRFVHVLSKKTSENKWARQYIRRVHSYSFQEIKFSS